MNTQFLTKPSILFNLFAVLSQSGPQPAQPIQASSCDYGFDYDEDKLGRELLTPLSASLVAQAMPQVAADEFESRYAWISL